MRGYHGLRRRPPRCSTRTAGSTPATSARSTQTGYLSITDRKKDLIKTSGGKYVAPQHVEGMLKLETAAHQPAVLIGNNRRFCAALISLAEEEILAWARTEGLEGKPYDELVRDPQVESLVRPHVEHVNSGLARHEKIKRWAILPSELKIESGELTPSLKVRRKVVEQHYRALLEELFAEKPEDLRE